MEMLNVTTKKKFLPLYLNVTHTTCNFTDFNNTLSNGSFERLTISGVK